MAKKYMDWIGPTSCSMYHCYQGDNRTKFIFIFMFTTEMKRKEINQDGQKMTKPQRGPRIY